jgi:dTDP-4-dehydrorhamnose 3,5-epimerase-like enzyme
MNSGKLVTRHGKIGDIKNMEPHFHKSFRALDQRGEFSKYWSHGDCAPCGAIFEPREMFLSKSVQKTIRGFHFFNSPGHLNRLVTVLEGEIKDVIFDRFQPRPFFIENNLNPSSDSLYVPSNYAHAFEVISPYATVLYLTDSKYNPSWDSGIHWSIYQEWQTKSPILSERDKAFPMR